jgi:hypothetical protein
MQIVIEVEHTQLRAGLSETPTARAIAAALPIEGRASRWGGEIYFSIPVQVELEPDARDVVEPGELAFWPLGRAFCVFFGPTPASTGQAPRAASPVNVVGRIEEDLTSLWDVPDGGIVSIRRASESG